jgi:hypothetical protein|tara:strand:+ start:131 stop:490 length:360 start_codon:yes stop_codon:yes gene_type:complete
MVKDWANTWHKTFKIIQDFGTDMKTVKVLRHVTCKDGFTFSLQAGPSHYCDPKAIAEKYESWEIGYPTKEEPLWLKWQEPGNIPTESVYGWVPNDIVNAVIHKHGGIDEKKFILDKLIK